MSASHPLPSPMATEQPPEPRPVSRKSRRDILLRMAVYGALLIGALVFLFPVYVIVTTSFKTIPEFGKGIWTLPEALNWSAYGQAWGAGLGRGIFNSLMIALPNVFISALIGSMTGYVFAMFRSRWLDVAFLVIILGMFIPYQVVLIPLVQFTSRLGVYNTYWGLILTHVAYGVPILTLIFTGYYRSISPQLIEAAQMDGCSLMGAWLRIMLPLSVTPIIIGAIWQFTSAWNDFLFALTLTQGPGVRPATVILAGLKGSHTAAYNLQMAGAVLSAFPTILVYVLLGRYFVRGLMAGSLKG